MKDVIKLYNQPRDRTPDEYQRLARVPAEVFENPDNKLLLIGGGLGHVQENSYAEITNIDLAPDFDPRSARYHIQCDFAKYPPLGIFTRMRRRFTLCQCMQSTTPRFDCSF
ncbi:MAG: hypothetical protein FWG18_01645 [Alphaproteobacteria bacterium]|nr:hypothetical protein [Alphaproteobacteria bacterium]